MHHKCQFNPKVHVRESVENFECDFNKTELLRLMREDGFGELNWEELKAHLNKISINCLDDAEANES